MAGNLEEGTKAYGVPLLISGPLYDTCTEEMQKYMRLIDVVHVRG
jgi:hypothetical protein